MKKHNKQEHCTLKIKRRKESAEEIVAELRSRRKPSSGFGDKMDDVDLLIASTAMYMNLSLVTNNKSHFGRVPDLVLENWEN